MFGTGSSSSLSDTIHSPVESSRCCLLISFSFLILALPRSVLSIVILNSSIFRSPGSCPADKVRVVEGSSGVILGCSLLGGGFFPAIPLGMVIVRVISSCFVIRRRHLLKITCEVELVVDLRYARYSPDSRPVLPEDLWSVVCYPSEALIGPLSKPLAELRGKGEKIQSIHARRRQH